MQTLSSLLSVINEVVRDKTPDWCRFEAVEPCSFKAEIAIVGLMTLQLIGTCAFIWRVRKTVEKRRFRMIYGLILCWLLALIVKTSLNIWAFTDYMQSSGKSLGSLRQLSSATFFFDVLATFFLQTLFLLVPHIWIHNCLSMLSNESFKRWELQVIGLSHKVVRWMRRYIYFRLSYPVMFVVFALLTSLIDAAQIVYIICVFLIELEAFLLLILYGCGLFFYRTMSGKIGLSSKDIVKWMWEFGMLGSCCILRIIINNFLLFSKVLAYKPNNDCSDVSEGQAIPRCVVIAVSIFLLHSLPAAIIMFVYWPNKESEKMLAGSDNLLNRKGDNNEENETNNQLIYAE